MCDHAQVLRNRRREQEITDKCWVIHLICSAFIFLTGLFYWQVGFSKDYREVAMYLDHEIDISLLEWLKMIPFIVSLLNYLVFIMVIKHPRAWHILVQMGIVGLFMFMLSVVFCALIVAVVVYFNEDPFAKIPQEKAWKLATGFNKMCCQYQLNQLKNQASALQKADVNTCYLWSQATSPQPTDPSFPWQVTKPLPSKLDLFCSSNLVVLQWCGHNLPNIKRMDPFMADSPYSRRNFISSIITKTTMTFLNLMVGTGIIFQGQKLLLI